MTESPGACDPAQLAEKFARERRLSDRIWLILAFAFLVGGGIVWCFSRNREHFYSGIFCAVFPLIGLAYTHFFLFRSRRDPLKTQQLLERLAERQRKNARATALVNGLILIISSPIFIVIGALAGNELRVGAVVGGVVGSIGLVVGLLLLASRRKSLRDDGMKRENAVQSKS